MSYRCGVEDADLGRLVGTGECNAHLVCDGCGTTRTVYRRRGWFLPAQWLLDGKHAPGWTGGGRGDGTRVDYCPRCSVAQAEAKP